jgi:hypothetical protein
MTVHYSIKEDMQIEGGTHTLCSKTHTLHDRDSIKEVMLLMTTENIKIIGLCA